MLMGLNTDIFLSHEIMNETHKKNKALSGVCKTIVYVAVFSIMAFLWVKASDVDSDESDKVEKIVVSISGCVKHSEVITANKPFSFKKGVEICGGLTEVASNNIIDVYRLNDDGGTVVIRLMWPDDADFKLLDRDMVVVRDKAYWSTSGELESKINKILSSE